MKKTEKKTRKIKKIEMCKVKTRVRAGGIPKG